MQLLLVFICYFVWSSSFTIGKATLAFSPPIFMTGVRMCIGGALILAFLALFRKKDLRIKKHHLLPLFLFTLTAIYFTNVFEFWGLQYLTAAKACFIYSLSPFLSAIFSYFQFNEKITSKKLLGLVIGFIGFIPVLLTQSSEEKMLGGYYFFSWAEIALIIATVSSVYGWVLLRKLGKNDLMSPLTTNGFSMMIGGVLALAHSFFTETWSPTPISNYKDFFRGVVLLIFVSNLFGYNLYGALLKRFSATFLSFAGLTAPIFSAFFGWLILSETVTWHFFLSLVIISLGLWLVYEEELRLGYIAQAKPS